jgi:hypothetical protein
MKTNLLSSIILGATMGLELVVPIDKTLKSWVYSPHKILLKIISVPGVPCSRYKKREAI